MKFGGPIVSTSANVAGEPEIREREKIEDVFGDSIDYVVDGELGDKHSTSEIGISLRVKGYVKYKGRL